MKSEAEIQAEIQIQGPYSGCFLERNNSGAFTDKDGRIVRFGLGNVSKKHSEKMKSSDLVGFTVITVTADMVGQKIAVFTAVEVKEENWKPSTTDKRELAQRNWIEWVKTHHGFAGFAWNLDSFRKILGR